jgi:hypothetical protein
VVRTVLVLGTHRSGTSLVTGMLHALGVNMGPPGADEKWIYPNFGNPTGQYENPEFTELLHQLLDFDGEEPRWDPRWDDLAAREVEFEPRFDALIRRTESELWGWKQAWTMLPLERLLPHLKNPYFVVVRRRLDDVVDSLHRRDGLSRPEAERVTREIWGRMERVQQAHPEVPALRLEYEEIGRDPRGTVRRLVQFLGISPSAEAMAKAESLVIQGPVLRRAIRHFAVHDLMTFPMRWGWVLRKDLREHSRFTRSHLTRSMPREFYRILRAMT